jgi:hypothetical protein
MTSDMPTYSHENLDLETLSQLLVTNPNLPLTQTKRIEVENYRKMNHDN